VKNRFQSLPFKCNLQRYTTGKEVWFTSNGDADDDMCRYAKAGLFGLYDKVECS
jgi:hypothetical protein